MNPLQSTIISPVNSTMSQQNQQQLLNRPTSAYFNTNNNKVNNAIPSHLSGHYVFPSNNANSNSSTNNLIGNQSHTLNNRQMNAFVRDTQNQQSLRMNQMMAPSMPNISYSGGYSSNISASQSMQNVNMIHPNYYVQSMSQQQQTNLNPNASNQMLNTNFANGYNNTNNNTDITAAKAQENAQTLDMVELTRRRQQRQQDMVPMYALDVNVHNSQNSMPNLSSGSTLLSPVTNQNDLMNNFRANSLTKGHSSQPGINYSHNSSIGSGLTKQLPPTAPKPMVCFHNT